MWGVMRVLVTQRALSTFRRPRGVGQSRISRSRTRPVLSVDGYISHWSSATFSVVHLLPPAEDTGILKVQLSFQAPNVFPEAHMAVSLKFSAAALALLIAGCTGLPTEPATSNDGASAVQNTMETASDSSTSRTGNLFGSGT